jgi:hypothetical protein
MLEKTPERSARLDSSRFQAVSFPERLAVQTERSFSFISRRRQKSPSAMGGTSFAAQTLVRVVWHSVPRPRSIESIEEAIYESMFPRNFFPGDVRSSGLDGVVSDREHPGNGDR